MLDRKDAKQITQYVLKEIKKASYPIATDGKLDLKKTTVGKIRGGTIGGLVVGAQAYVAKISFSPLDYDTIVWASGNVVLLDGRIQPIASGLLDLTDETYLYCVWGNNQLQHTTNYNNVIGNSKVLVAIASPATDPTSLAYVSNPHSTDILVTTDKVMDNLVTELKLANEAVTNAKIAVDAIYGDVIKAAAVTETKISDNAVTTPKIVASGIVASKIAAGAIVAEKIATNAVVAEKIATNAVTSEKINAGAVTAAKINVSTLSAITANCGTLTAGTIDGVTIYAGGGNVQLDGDGLTVFGGNDSHYKYNSTRKGVFGAGSAGMFLETDNGADLILYPDNPGVIICETDIVTEDIDASTTAYDIGYSTEFDDIYCDTIHYNGGSLPDDLDDLAVIKQLKTADDDRSKLSMDSLPSYLRYDREEFIAKAMKKINDSNVRLHKRLQSKLNEISEIKTRLPVSRRGKLQEVENSIRNKLNNIGKDDDKKLNKAMERFEYIRQRFLSANKTIALSLGALKQVAYKLDAIESRLDVLEARL